MLTCTGVPEQPGAEYRLYTKLPPTTAITATAATAAQPVRFVRRCRRTEATIVSPSRSLVTLGQPPHHAACASMASRQVALHSDTNIRVGGVALVAMTVTILRAIEKLRGTIGSDAHAG